MLPSRTRWRPGFDQPEAKVLQYLFDDVSRLDKANSTVSLLSQRLDEHKERMIMKAKRKIFLDCASNADPCALVVN